MHYDMQILMKGGILIMNKQTLKQLGRVIYF